MVNQCYPNKNDQEDKNWKRTEFNGLYLRLKLNFRRMIPDGEGHQVGKLEGGVRIGSFVVFQDVEERQMQQISQLLNYMPVWPVQNDWADGEEFSCFYFGSNMCLHVAKS